jgi:hypothetical protein
MQPHIKLVLLRVYIYVFCVTVALIPDDIIIIVNMPLSD